MKKAQVWYIDYMMATFIFVIAIVLYFEVTSNLSREEEGNLNEMTLDASSVTGSLLSEGYPTNWTSLSVKRIGLVSDGRVDRTKYHSLSNISYQEALYKFGIVYQFYFFFEDRDGNTRYLSKQCGYGHPSVTLNKTSTDDYAYYRRTDGESILEPYLSDATLLDESDSVAFINGMRDYRLVILEDPLFPLEYGDNISAYVAAGGTIVASGRIIDIATAPIWGVTYANDSVCRNASVISQHPFVNLSIGENIQFNRCPYLSTDAGKLANLTNTTSGVAHLHTGSGQVFYFSSFNGTVETRPLGDTAAELVEYLITGTCSSLDPFSLGADDLVTTTRLITYDNQILKMVMYLWD